MIYLLHSETDAGSIGDNLGASEYSYYFVLKAYRPVLERLGTVVAIGEAVHEADAVHRAAASRGEGCVYLSFAPPHRTLLPERCPIVPVFAWEFDTLPNEPWDGDERQDWTLMLRRMGRAITHSDFAVAATRRAMGADFPVASIPAPVWDGYAGLAARPATGGLHALAVEGRVFDSRALDLAPYMPQARRAHGAPEIPPDPAGRRARQALELSGIVYTTVFSPYDGRKNWFDLMGAFCWAFRDEPNATLVMKLTHWNCGPAIVSMLGDLAKLQPFACRVILIDGYLPDAHYEGLVAASHYTVNASTGEGQCLPLMEFCSAGRPAIAPQHTAMVEYLTPENAFIVAAQPEPGAWPHDPRQAFRTLRYRISFESLVAAYRESYRVATAEPARYAAMAEAASESLRRHCSRAVMQARFEAFMHTACEPVTV